MPGPPGAQLGGVPASVPASGAPIASVLASATGTQLPFLQLGADAGQVIPQPPQLLGSVCSFTQTMPVASVPPAQIVSPLAEQAQ
jgi:hypothetical protein